MASAPRLQALALFALGALVVHELRYLLGYGPEDGVTSSGHGYLEFVVPVLVGLFALACAYLVRTTAARPEIQQSRRRRFLSAWLLGALALAAIFIAQELLEQAFAGDHVALADLLPGGGWLVLPLSLATSLVIALLLVGARAVLRAASRSTRRTAPSPAIPDAPDRPHIVLPRLTVAGINGALRGPPRLQS